MATATPTPPARGIAALDVPAAAVEEQVKKLMAIELDRLQQAVADGRLAEQRHWLDADPDPALFHLPGIEHKEEADRG